MTKNYKNYKTLQKKTKNYKIKKIRVSVRELCQAGVTLYRTYRMRTVQQYFF